MALQTIRSFFRALNLSGEAPDSAAQSHGEFIIRPDDVYVVRRIFLALKLPAEIGLMILDEAQYRPKIIAHQSAKCNVRASDSSSSLNSALYLMTPRIPFEAFKNHTVRRVKFSISSHDQGWMIPPQEEELPYSGGHSWFEVHIIRPSHPTLPPATIQDAHQRLESPDFLYFGDFRLPGFICALQDMGFTIVPNPTEANVENALSWYLQCNKVADEEWREHTVEWPSPNGEEDFKMTGRGTGAQFVESLQPGDQIALCARAQYPGWRNVVREASIEIEYDV